LELGILMIGNLEFGIRRMETREIGSWGCSAWPRWPPGSRRWGRRTRPARSSAAESGPRPAPGANFMKQFRPEFFAGNALRGQLYPRGQILIHKSQH
jgi:hypothetical protein